MSAAVITKVCVTCGEGKSLGEFGPSKTGRLGTTAKCRSCLRVYRNARRAIRIAQHGDMAREQERQGNRRYRKRHRERANEQSQRWRVANPDKRADTVLRHGHGIGLEEYNSMLEAQGGVCGSCGRSETAVDPRTGRIRRLHVDHDHVSGKIRGLLCTKCNMAVGFVEDDPSRARSIAWYLERYQ